MIAGTAFIDICEVSACGSGLRAMRHDQRVKMRARTGFEMNHLHLDFAHWSIRARIAAACLCDQTNGWFAPLASHAQRSQLSSVTTPSPSPPTRSPPHSRCKAQPQHVSHRFTLQDFFKHSRLKLCVIKSIAFRCPQSLAAVRSEHASIASDAGATHQVLKSFYASSLQVYLLFLQVFSRSLFPQIFQDTKDSLFFHRGCLHGTFPLPTVCGLFPAYPGCAVAH